MKITWEQRTIGECGTLSDVPAGATILKVNDEEVIGRCVSCGAIIMAEDEYEEDGEGIYLCQECAETFNSAYQKAAKAAV